MRPSVRLLLTAPSFGGAKGALPATTMIYPFALCRLPSVMETIRPKLRRLRQTRWRGAEETGRPRLQRLPAVTRLECFSPPRQGRVGGDHGPPHPGRAQPRGRLTPRATATGPLAGSDGPPGHRGGGRAPRRPSPGPGPLDAPSPPARQAPRLWLPTRAGAGHAAPEALAPASGARPPASSPPAARRGARPRLQRAGAVAPPREVVAEGAGRAARWGGQRPHGAQPPLPGGLPAPRHQSRPSRAGGRRRPCCRPRAAAGAPHPSLRGHRQRAQPPPARPAAQRPRDPAADGHGAPRRRAHDAFGAARPAPSRRHPAPHGWGPVSGGQRAQGAASAPPAAARHAAL
jgi:hypothetical protein